MLRRKKKRVSEVSFSGKIGFILELVSANYGLHEVGAVVKDDEQF